MRNRVNEGEYVTSVSFTLSESHIELLDDITERRKLKSKSETIRQLLEEEVKVNGVAGATDVQGVQGNTGIQETTKNPVDGNATYKEAFKSWEKLINEEYYHWKMLSDTQMAEEDFKDWVVQKLIALFALSEKNRP